MDSITHKTLLLNLDEVAEQLRCNRRSVERQVAANQLEVVRIGRAVRVERRMLEAFIASLRDRRSDGEGRNGG